MATVTKGRTFVSGEVVTPTKLNTLVDSATVTQIVDADISATAAIAGSKLADASITQAKFASSVILVPTGAVMPFAMNSAPTGWLASDGSAVSRATYAALFAAIGTLYGVGDGSTTFNLPDLRASFVRGAGSDGVATAGTFGAKQAEDYKSHNHAASDSGHAHTTTAGAGAVYSASAPYSSGTAPSYTGTSTSVGYATITVANSGGTETRPRNIAMLYCIKF